MKKLQNQKTNLISKTRKPAFYYAHTHTHVVLKGQNNKNNGVQNASTVYVAKLGNECLNNIHENATDYVDIKITNVISNIILNKILRREIPKWNGSSCGAFFQKKLCPFWNSYEFLPKRVPPFGIPTNFFQRGFPPLESPRRALPFEPALRSEGQILPYWLP